MLVLIRQNMIQSWSDKTYQRKSKNKTRKTKFISDSSESESDSSSSGTTYKNKSKKIKPKNKSGMVAKASDYVVNPQIWPHTVLQYEYINKSVSFQDLDLLLGN